VPGILHYAGTAWITFSSAEEDKNQNKVPYNEVEECSGDMKMGTGSSGGTVSPWRLEGALKGA
jgi:hypothetical protein